MILALPLALAAQTRTYTVYVASEAADRISIVDFDGVRGTVRSDFETGVMPMGIDGPHGLGLSPDGTFMYVSLAHGQPNGTVVKYSTATNAIVGQATLGLFPATLQTSPDGSLLFVANFNLHGDPVPSSVSVVLTDGMAEIARVRTCRMPHGSRLNPSGKKHYSVCMMDDLLVEIDTSTLKVSRHFVTTRGKEAGHEGSPAAMAAMSMNMVGMAGHAAEAPPAGSTDCSPTWAQPSADGTSIFVACNGTSDIVEIDAARWTMRRRFVARPGVYNLAVTHDGRRLVATNRRDQSVSLYDIASGTEIARLSTKRRVVHGVVVSPDDEYAFVSVEGIAGEPGTVEIIDLAAHKTLTTIDVAPQAGGIDVVRR
jgi:DNA-binding beta-propeller fold protein YncE